MDTIKSEVGVVCIPCCKFFEGQLTRCPQCGGEVIKYTLLSVVLTDKKE